MGTVLSDLKPVSVDEVKQLISSMPAKSSPMDVFPTSLLKSCVDTLAPLIARLARLSFPVEVLDCLGYSVTHKYSLITMLYLDYASYRRSKNMQNAFK